MVFVKKSKFLPCVFFGQIRPENISFGYSGYKRMLSRPNKSEVSNKFKKSKFSNRVSPRFLTIIRTFYHVCVFGKLSQKRSLFDILDRKESLLD